MNMSREEIQNVLAPLAARLKRREQDRDRRRVARLAALGVLVVRTEARPGMRPASGG